MSNIPRHLIPKYGFSDLAHRSLSKFIGVELLSRLPLTHEQIDNAAEYLNWDIISNRNLPIDLLIKHKKLINWQVYLFTPRVKCITDLLKISDILRMYSHVFQHEQLKLQYFTYEFLLVFPQYVDWNWYIKRHQLPDFLLLRHWNDMDIINISTHQMLSDDIVEKKKFSIKWALASYNPLSEKSMNLAKYLLDWDIICQRQTLSIEFIIAHLDFIKLTKYRIELLVKHQILSEEFILQNLWLPLNTVSKYQKLSMEFIKKNLDILYLDLLMENTHYNKQNSIQIVKIQDRYYIFIADENKVCFL